MSTDKHVETHDDLAQADDKKKAEVTAPGKEEKKAEAEVKKKVAKKKKRARDDDPDFKGTAGTRRRKGTKPPMSGYLVFVKENMRKIKDENPTVKQKQVMVLLGQKWAQVTDQEKAQYKAKAQAAAAAPKEPEAKKAKTNA